MVESKFKVGDRVMCVELNHRGSPQRPVTITKVGRKYVYVDGRSDPYDPMSGVIQDGWGNRVLRTSEDVARIAEAERIDGELKSFDLDLWRISAEKRVQVYEALRAAGHVK